MPEFLPFRALRYAADDLAPLVAPPYDVLSDADVDALQAQSDHNITRIDVPRGGADRYRQAAGLLQDWRRTGVLVADEVPSYTLYRMRFTDASGTPETSPGWSAAWRSPTRGRVACCRTNAPRPRPPPTGST